MIIVEDLQVTIPLYRRNVDVAPRSTEFRLEIC
jgi:hypothetical protein